MICRVWHGWTAPENADAYETLLRGEIFRGIGERRIEGFRGIDLLRREAGPEVEFVTVMWFDSLAAVRAFAGPDHEAAVVPPAARALLARFDERSAHFEVRERRTAEAASGERPDLTETELRFLEGCRDDALTRRRMRQVVILAALFALLLVTSARLTGTWHLPVGVGLLYIAITTWEKLAYGRGVRVYKSLVRKLERRAGGR